MAPAHQRSSAKSPSRSKFGPCSKFYPQGELTHAANWSMQQFSTNGGCNPASMFKYKKCHNTKTFGANSPHGPTCCVGQFAMWVISLHIHSVSINCVVTFLYLNIDFGSLPPLVPTLILGPHHHWYQFTM